MDYNECLEFCKAITQEKYLSEALTTNGTNANKILQIMATVLCRVKNNTQYMQDAINLVLQDDFSDSDKSKIFDNILSQKEEGFDLYKSNIFTVPSDLQSRIELLRIVEAITRGKVQSISDVKKVLSFLGVDDVEFHFEHPNTFINTELTLAYWGYTNYEYVNTWKVYLPASLFVDEEKKQNIENFILTLKAPQDNYQFYYIL
jgi:hypothetical protein